MGVANGWTVRGLAAVDRVLAAAESWDANGLPLPDAFVGRLEDIAYYLTFRANRNPGDRNPAYPDGKNG